MAFPSNPNNGQKVSRFGRSYKFNSSSNTWDPVKQTSTVSAGSVAAATDIIPNADLQYDLGSPTNRFRDLYLSSNSIYLGDNTVLSADKVLEFDTVVQPEQLEIQVDAPGAGHDPSWVWTWEQSSLPFSRLQITNSTQLSVPLYMQGSYVINNYASSLHGDQTQTHLFKLKWIEGAGDANLVDWVVYSTADDSHPDIDGGNTHTIQRLTVNIPATVTPPTLVAPAITYDVTASGAPSWYFTGTLHGSNPEMGPFYRGGTYTINVTGAGHPFYFTTDNGSGFVTGSYVGEYTDGVTGSRTELGTITFTVPETAPDTLYYQCGNHSSMRGVIRVKDLAVEVNENGNFVIYGQHSQDGHIQPIELRPLPSLASQMCLVYDATRQQWVPQDLATYVENTPRFKNKIKEVAGTATLVAPDGTSLVASVEIYSDSSYLPQIGNTSGDIAFVEDTQELKVWKTGTGWLDITAGGGDVGGATPTITGVSPANYDGADQATFTIIGTNFDIGTVVDFITQNGTAYRSSVTSVTTQGELTAITPQAFLTSDGPLDIKITTSTGATVTANDVIQTGGLPVWDTPAGTLYQNAYLDDITAGDNSYRLGMDLNETISATDPDGQFVSYSVVSGSLPPNATLEAGTGNISGTLPGTGVLSGDTTYNFTAGATDTSGNLSTRLFNIIVKNQPASLYNFTSHSFNNAGAWGPNGPSLEQVRSAYSSATWAQDSNFLDVNSGVQIWTVPKSGTYRITATGAMGADGIGGSATPGYGYRLYADFTLEKSTIINIICGQSYQFQRSGSQGGGGGGGSFVWVNGATLPLIVAAGGNGESWESHTVRDPSGQGIGVTPVNGGGRGYAGAGWDTDGDGTSVQAIRVNTTTNPGRGGNSTFTADFTNRLMSGTHGGNTLPGGFGGGGATNPFEGGGGGGYLGGKPKGTNQYSNSYTSSGASSYVNPGLASNVTEVGNATDYSGSVLIQLL